MPTVENTDSVTLFAEVTSSLIEIFYVIVTKGNQINQCVGTKIREPPLKAFLSTENDPVQRNRVQR